MDLLEEGNLLLQTLNASLQVQPGQSGIVNILDAKKKKNVHVYLSKNVLPPTSGFEDKMRK